MDSPFNIGAGASRAKEPRRQPDTLSPFAPQAIASAKAAHATNEKPQQPPVVVASQVPKVSQAREPRRQPDIMSPFAPQNIKAKASAPVETVVPAKPARPGFADAPIMASPFIGAMASRDKVPAPVAAVGATSAEVSGGV